MNATQYAVVDDVVAELDRAVAKFPNQSWEWGGARHWESQANWYKRINDAALDGGKPATWLDILMEEVMEAATETEPAKVYAELLQVAAMAIRAAHDVQRRSA